MLVEWVLHRENDVYEIAWCVVVNPLRVGFKERIADYPEGCCMFAGASSLASSAKKENAPGLPQAGRVSSSPVDSDLPPVSPTVEWRAGRS